MSLERYIVRAALGAIMVGSVLVRASSGTSQIGEAQVLLAWHIKAYGLLQAHIQREAEFQKASKEMNKDQQKLMNKLFQLQPNQLANDLMRIVTGWESFIKKYRSVLNESDVLELQTMKDSINNLWVLDAWKSGNFHDQVSGKSFEPATVESYFKGWRELITNNLLSDKMKKFVGEAQQKWQAELNKKTPPVKKQPDLQPSAPLQPEPVAQPSAPPLTAESGALVLYGPSSEFRNAVEGIRGLKCDKGIALAAEQFREHYNILARTVGTVGPAYVQTAAQIVARLDLLGTYLEQAVKVDELYTKIKNFKFLAQNADGFKKDILPTLKTVSQSKLKGAPLDTWKQDVPGYAKCLDTVEQQWAELEALLRMLTVMCGKFPGDLYDQCLEFKEEDLAKIRLSLVNPAHGDTATLPVVKDLVAVFVHFTGTSTANALNLSDFEKLAQGKKEHLAEYKAFAALEKYIPYFEQENIQYLLSRFVQVYTTAHLAEEVD